MFRIVRIARLARRESGELGGYRLAQDHCACRARKRNHRGIGFRLVTGVDRRAVFGRQVPRVEDVFYADGQSVQGTADRAAVEFLRVPDSAVAPDAGPGLDLGLALIDALEQRAHKDFCGELAAAEPANQFDGGQFVQRHPRYFLSSVGGRQLKGNGPGTRRTRTMRVADSLPR